MTVKTGTANYGGTKKKNFKIVDGSNVYRILPPLGKCADTGVWAKFESVHWGYKGSNGWNRQFRCPQQKRNKIVVVTCAECDLIAEHKTDYDKRLDVLVKGEGVPLETAKAKLKPLGDWLASHNRDNKWLMNAMNMAGEIGRLAIPHKMYQSLQLAIADLIKKKIDPTSVDGGVYFDFQRSGKGRDTIHNVRVDMEKFVPPGQTEEYERVKRAPLTTDVLNRLEAETYDLSDMFRNVTPDDVARLVASGGDANVVDSVFSSPESKSTVATPGVGMMVGSFAEPDEEPSDEEKVATTAQLSVNPGKSVAVVEAPVVDDEEAQLLAQLAAAKARKLSKAAAEKKVEVVSFAAPKIPQATSEMSNEDFLANFGAKKA